MQTNVLEYLEQTVRTVPEKVAFIGEDTKLTFRQLYDQSRAIGSFLHREAIYKKSVVVFMKKQPRTIAAFLGVIYGGCFYVPLDEEMPRHRIELILSKLSPGAILYDETTRPSAEALTCGCKIISYDDAAFGVIDEAALGLIRERQLDIDPIYIVFTSGSTGVPKGVMGNHRAVIDYIENLCGVLRFDETTVFGNQTPLYFDACLKEIMATLKYGAQTYLIPKHFFLFPVRMVEYLNQHKINTICWVVSALTFLSSLGTFQKVRPKFLRTIAFASEVFPIRQLHIWQDALPHARFINLYGPTETTGICCYYEVDREFSEDETLPIGRPFRNTEILLLDEQDQVPDPGEQGEICIRGTRLTLGYYHDPDRTAEVFTQNPLNTLYPDPIYRTGDLGRYNSRGELEFISRKDFQIKYIGHRIELGEIEAAAHTHPAVGSACCLFDSDEKKIILCYVGAISPAGLLSHLKEKLPRYMIPHVLRQLPIMPLTPNGKIDRSNLLKRSFNHE